MEYSTRNKKHSPFRDEVCGYLEKRLRCHVEPNGYEDVVLEVERIENIDVVNEDAMRLRDRPDCKITLPDGCHTFFLEAKTNYNKRPDMKLPATQLMHNVKNYSKYRERCLYVYKNERGKEFGFWVSEVPLFNKFFMPEGRKWDQEAMNFFRKTYRWFRDWYFDRSGVGHLTQMPFDNPKAPLGSGFPFILIKREVYTFLPHWKELIEAEMVRIGHKWSA